MAFESWEGNRSAVSIRLIPKHQSETGQSLKTCEDRRLPDSLKLNQRIVHCDEMSDNLAGNLHLSRVLLCAVKLRDFSKWMLRIEKRSGRNFFEDIWGVFDLIWEEGMWDLISEGKCSLCGGMGEIRGVWMTVTLITRHWLIMWKRGEPCDVVIIVRRGWIKVRRPTHRNRH